MYEFIFFAVIMYESYIFLQKLQARASRERAPQARSASCERAARAARAKPELTSCPDQAAPNLCRSDHSHLFKSRYIESDQNIQIQFYMQRRSNYDCLTM